MRTTHRRQLSLPVPSVTHKHARMLASMAAILDAMPELEEQVLSDLTSDGVRSDFGRDGLSAQQVLRLMVLYTMLRTTFEQLEFHLADSPTYRAFCLLGLTDPPPKHASIAGNLSKLRPQTLQALHTHVVRYAVEHKLETVSAVRTDTTSVAAPIRAPLDSALLSDSVRVLERLLKRACTAHKQANRCQAQVTHRSIARAQSLRMPSIRSATSATRGQSAAINALGITSCLASIHDGSATPENLQFKQANPNKSQSRWIGIFARYPLPHFADEA